MSATIVPTVYVALGLGLATTAFGIFVEKHFVCKWSILFNCIGMAAMALTLKTSEVLAFILLILYAVAGAVIVFSKWKGTVANIVKQLFGSKMYGSISLAFVANSLDGSYISKQVLYFLESQGFTKLFDSYIVFFSWILIAILVYLISGFVLLFGHQKLKKR